MTQINLIFALIFIVSLLKIIKSNPVYSGIFIYLGVLQFWFIISNNYLNLGQWEGKLNIATYENYSAVFLIIVYLIFNYFLSKFLLKDIKKSFVVKREYNYTHRSLVFLFSTLITFFILLIIPLLKFGIPILSGINRAEYYSSVSWGLFGLVYRYHYIVPFLIGGIISLKYRNKYSFRRTLLLLLFAYFIFLVLVGNKFSALFLGFTCFLFASDYSRNLVLRATKNYRQLFLISFSILIVILIFSYIIYFQVTMYYNPASFMNDYFIPRVLKSQSSLWWASWEEAKTTNLNLTKGFVRELTNIYSKFEDKYKVGHFFLMVHHGGYKAFLVTQKGFAYTGGYPAILLYIFPIPVILFFQILLAYIFSKLLYQLKKNIIQLDLISIVILVQFFLSFFSFYWMGNIHAFFSKRNFVLLFILIVYKLTKKYNRIAYKKKLFTTISNCPNNYESGVRHD